MALFTAFTFHWIMGLVRQLHREEGEGLAEYGLILALLAATGILLLVALGWLVTNGW